MVLKMCETNDQKNPNIPKNADKVLFAEDFVNYVLLQFTLPYLSSGIADYRSSIYNAFNATVRVAVNFLYRRLEKDNLTEFENILLRGQPLNRDAFMNYVTSMELEYLSTGFDAQKLLHFCVKTATMAVRFYCSGFDEGPALAAQRIENILDDYDMSSGGWERVNFIAANYARIYVDVDNTLTPESESEYESASESSTDSGDYSEASDTVTAVPPSISDDIKNENQEDFSECEVAEKSSDSSDSPDDEDSVASCSDLRSADETGVDYGSRQEDVQMELPGPHSEFNTPYASDEDDSNASCSSNADVETSSDDETKYDDIQEQESETFSSIYSSDTDEECFDDVFEECGDETPACDQFGRQLAKKRPASSSSSTNGFHLLGSEDQFNSCLTLPSTSSANKDLSASSLNSKNSSDASNDKLSPPRKHVAKTRRRC